MKLSSHFITRLDYKSTLNLYDNGVTGKASFRAQQGYKENRQQNGVLTEGFRLSYCQEMPGVKLGDVRK